MDPIVTAIIVIVVLAAIGFFALIKSIIIVQQSTAVVIERLGINGEGVAKCTDGKVCFVPFSLPNEEVNVEYFLFL